MIRRTVSLPESVDELVRLHPALVWMQLGIRNEDAARRLTAAGIDVVEDRCLMIEHRRALGTPHPEPQVRKGDPTP